MNEKLTAPILALKATGEPPLEGDAIASDGEQCLTCARKMKEGEKAFWADDVLQKKAFTNWSQLTSSYQRGKGRRKSSAKICPHCRTIMGDRKWLMPMASAVITQDGIFRFSKNCEIAYWLLNPPEPPFAMAIRDQQQQHIWWRTPVNWDKRIIRLRLGEKILLIRPEMLQKGLKAVNAISDAIRGKKKFESPFQGLSRDMKDVGKYTLKEKVEQLRTDDKLRPHIELLETLTPGELWAVSSILPYAEPCPPERME